MGKEDGFNPNIGEIELKKKNIATATEDRSEGKNEAENISNTGSATGA